ncbi:unnamed protein product [Amaranthus hypochondriacus]
MESESSQPKTMTGILPIITPVLLISISYIDPGKWVASIDTGARFGVDLAVFALAFNFVAVLCHYLTAHVTVITGKNLSQICSEEYDKLTCIFLGIQMELSVIALDLTMILGIAHGLNTIFGLDMFSSILLTALNVVLYPIFSTLLESVKGKFLVVCLAGITLVFYVLGMLFSLPEFPVPSNNVLSKLSGESAFALMSLLGANVMPHNFYLHSSIVQRYQGPAMIKGLRSQDHFVISLVISSGVFIVNYILMNSAANVYYSTGLGLFTFQEAVSLLDQAYRNLIIPFASFVILFLANQITALSWEFCGEGGESMLHGFFGMDLPEWLHRATIRIFAVVPALFCLWQSGAEGLYHMLICTQVMVALILPSSVIPLFRIATSRPIMSLNKISPIQEFVVLLTFIGMLGLEIIFVVEMIFGESDWVGTLRWSLGNTATSIAYVFLLVTACTSLSFMLWLAATPLKSATAQLDSHPWNWDAQQAAPELYTEGRGNDVIETRFFEEEEPHVKPESLPFQEKSLHSHMGMTSPSYEINLPETIMDTVQEPCANAMEEKFVENRPDGLSKCRPDLEKSDASVDLVPVSNVVIESSDDSRLPSSPIINEPADPVEKTLRIESDTTVDKDDELDTWESADVSKDVAEVGPPATLDGPRSFRSLSGKNDEGGPSAGSLSRLSGLGRAARRQLAAALDEFWGQLYDFHGQLTKEAQSKKLDLLLGLNTKPITSLTNADSSGKEYGMQFHSLGGRLSDNPMSIGLSDAQNQHKLQSSMDSAYRVQKGSVSLWPNQMQFLNSNVQSSSRSMLDAGERRYQSLRLPPSSDAGERRYQSLRLPPSSDADERRYQSLRLPPSSDAGERRYQSLRLPPSSDALEYQPATVHGYQFASYLDRIAKERSDYGVGALEAEPRKSPSLVPNNYRESLAFALGQKLSNGYNSVHQSNIQNVAVQRNSVFQSENIGYDLPFNASAESNNTKKYHSLPDISGLSVPLRNLYSSNRSDRLDSPNTSVGYGTAVGRTSYEPSSLLSTRSRLAAPLAFDELSPSRAYRDAMSLRSSSGADTCSLWSKQPFEHFGVANKDSNLAVQATINRSTMMTQELPSVADMERKLLQSLRHCILKLLKLEGSEWLFRQNDGVDEDLVDRVAMRERFFYEVDSQDNKQSPFTGDSQYQCSERSPGALSKGGDSVSSYVISSVPQCGEGCVWKVDLIVSFGVWCIRRILELSLMESRPELWGKYTYVLNRLQGVIEVAFFKPRTPMPPCICLQIPASYQMRSSPPVSNGMLPPASRPASKGKVTTSAMLLDMIKDVEIAISCRKGRSGTAAGDVAFPKGKENLASVLKRYKRRLSNKSVGT